MRSMDTGARPLRAGRWAVLMPSLLLMLALAFLLNSPVPPRFSQPWKLRLMLAPMKLLFTLGDLAGYWQGVDHRVHLIRNVMDTMAARRLQGNTSHITVNDYIFDGVPVRVYKPTPGVTPSGVGIIFFHGGGWVYGGMANYDHVTRRLCRDVKATVISVGYRLAPEYIYPKPLEDCIIATKYVLHHANDLDLNRNHIVLAGDSAGGNMAAAVSLYIRDEGIDILPKLQILIYPSLQPINFEMRSYVKNANDVIWGKAHQIQSWLLYAVGDIKHLNIVVKSDNTSQEMFSEKGIETIKDDPQRFYDSYHNKDVEPLCKIFLDEYFSPLLARDLSGLPKSLIITMEQDILKDEGHLYAQRLESAGNNVTYVNYESGFHGIFLFHNFIETEDMYRDITNFIKNNTSP